MYRLATMHSSTDKQTQ